jgi:hypothetical protein
LPPNVLERSELSSAQWAPEMSDQDRVFLEMSVAEVDRFRELDKVIPSYHNVISIAVLEVHISFTRLISILTFSAVVQHAHQRKHSTKRFPIVPGV